MISPQAALKIVLNTILPNKVEKILLEDAFGRTLAEDLIADRPFPPFDRVTMDGIAINFQEFEKGKREFEILGIQTAGEAPIGAKNNSGCIEIMTGAMLPDGFDTVIRYEDLKIFGGIANVISEKIKPGQNIHYKGSDATLGQVIVEKSTKINAAIMAVAATIGKLELLVTSNPRIIILATGDELVQVNQTPKDYQIRASNTWAISSILKKEGFDAEMCLLKDEPQILEREIFQMLQKYDVLIFSGGVSMGKKDYLPEILASLGIKKHFHKISQKPGKPMWFGSTEQNIIFALPGNPVSSFLCTAHYVLPWLQNHVGEKSEIFQKVKLESEENNPFDLTFFKQAKLKNESGNLLAKSLPNNGSGDFVNLSKSDGFIVFPPKAEGRYLMGEIVDFLKIS
ncbi:MAG: molybdopterin molybdotransferase MoeA [Cytophagaceae bacterium]|nr:molybdopterin molybdotransferase MoeA [Cytophagaceae bacterium]MBL0301874.1 molybdopterin molybdotransferase MoeA [Cytophagaceae bacterium]